MLSPDSLIFLVRYSVLFIYGAILIVSITFTFFINTFNRFNEILNISLVSKSRLNPLGGNINFFDEWLHVNHKIIGPILIMLSGWEMIMLFKILGQL